MPVNVHPSAASTIVAQAVAMTVHQHTDPFDVYPKDADALNDWIQEVMGDHIPSKGVCPGHDAPFQFVSDFFFNEVSEGLALAPRSGGKTFNTAVLHLANNHHKPGFEVSHIGAIEAQAKRCYSYYTRGLRHPKLQAKAPDPHIRETVWLNGSKIEILPGTEAQTQGGHPHMVTYDELEQGKRQPYENAKSMPVERRYNGTRHRGQFLATSTRQTSLGLMQRALDEAEESGTRVYQWCLAADTSVETEYGPRPIQDVCLGDRVYSWHKGHWGLYRVAWSGYTGTKRTLVITLSNGRDIRATEDHEFRTVKGWQRAGDLRKGTELFGLRQASQAPEAERRSKAQDHPLSSVQRVPACPTPETMPVRRGDTAPFPAVHRLLPQGDSGTESTTGNVSRRETRSEVMAVSAVQSGASSSGAVQGDWPARSGTSPVRLAGRRFRSVGQAISHRGVRGLLARDIRGEGTRCAAEAHPEIRGVHASCATRLKDASVVAADTERVTVVAVRDHGLEPVYDLTVPGAHSFVAEGVVVHNCVFETMEPCDGQGDRPDCNTEECPLWQWCEGRAVNADGWRSRDEIIGMYRRVGIDTWEAQHLCIKPDAKALIYAPFSRENITEEAEYVAGAGALWVGYDWGWTHKAHFCFVQERDGVFYQFEELVGDHTEEREWVRSVVRVVVALDGYEGPTLEEWEKIWDGPRRGDEVRWPHPWPEVWPGAAGAWEHDHIRKEFKEHGITAAPSSKVKHLVVAGQDVLRAAIRSGDLIRYYVHPRCKATIRCLSNYRAQELSDGSFSEGPDPDPANHAFSDGCDALRALFWRLRRALGITGGSDDDSNTP